MDGKKLGNFIGLALVVMLFVIVFIGFVKLIIWMVQQ